MIHLEKLAKDVVLHPCSDMEIVRTTRYLFIGVAAMFTQDEYISSSQIPQLLNQMADFIKQGKVTEYVHMNNGQVPAVSEFMFNKVLSRSNISLIENYLLTNICASNLG